MNAMRIYRVAIVMALLLSITCICHAGEDTWTTKANMPTRRLGLSTSAVNGKLYAIGGGNSIEGSAFRTVEEYDPATDTWTKKADMPTQRYFHAASVVNGKVYLIGGATSEMAITPTVEEYDPSTDTWTRKADMPTARCFLSAGVVNGKIYAIGGQIYPGDFSVPVVEEYNPVIDTWIKKADMPTARSNLDASVVNGKIYVIGGVIGGIGGSGTSIVEEYDPASDTWARKADMPTRRKALSVSTVAGKIYASGGGTGYSNPFSTLEEYDPATDTWTRKANMPITRYFHSTSAVNGKIYAIGGSSQFPPHNSISTVEEYDTGFTTTTPQPDFNGDGIIDIKDLLRLIESWGQDDSMVDLAPPPFGDGVVDALDLEVLMSYWGQLIDDPTLIAHWSLDETEGAVAYDSAGVNNASIIGEPVWQPEGGRIGGALALDGIDDCAVAGPVLNPADGPFSVLAWIQGGAPGQVVISQFNRINWLGVDSAWGCLMTELQASSRDATSLRSEIVITDGSWYRIGFVWDGLYRALYVDDILVAQDTQQGLASSTGGLNIGCGSDSAAGTFWSGLIDEVRIYSRAVSP